MCFITRTTSIHYIDRESVDELAHDLERLLDKASPGFPAEIQDRELKYHLMNALPEKVSLQLKLLPMHTYTQMIPKATKWLLIYQRVDKEEGHIQQINPKEEQVSEQLTTLSRPLNLSWKPPRTRRFNDIECYNCGKRGHLARNRWHSGNSPGGIFTRRVGGAPRFQ